MFFIFILFVFVPSGMPSKTICAACVLFRGVFVDFRQRLEEAFFLFPARCVLSCFSNFVVAFRGRVPVFTYHVCFQEPSLCYDTPKKSIRTSWLRYLSVSDAFFSLFHLFDALLLSGLLCVVCLGLYIPPLGRNYVVLNIFSSSRLFFSSIIEFSNILLAACHVVHPPATVRGVTHSLLWVALFSILFFVFDDAIYAQRCVHVDYCVLIVVGVVVVVVAKENKASLSTRVRSLNTRGENMTRATKIYLCVFYFVSFCVCVCV